MASEIIGKYYHKCRDVKDAKELKLLVDEMSKAVDWSSEIIRQKCSGHIIDIIYDNKDNENNEIDYVGIMAPLIFIEGVNYAGRLHSRTSKLFHRIRKLAK